MRRINDRNGYSAYLDMIAKAVSDCNYDIFFLVNDESFDFSQYCGNKEIKLISAKSKPYSLRQNIEIPLLVKKHRIDILHCTNFDIPVFFRLICPGAKLLSTIHDLIPINRMDLRRRNLLKNLYFKFMFNMCAKMSDRIITVSEYSRRDAVNTLKINPDIIKAVHCSFKGKVRTPAGKIKSKPQSDFKLFFIGNNFPHKNIAVVVDAVKILKDRGINVIFNIAGMETGYTDLLRKKINDYDIADRVKILGRISDKEAERCYLDSDIFVFPSLAEGFGSPLIEAMNYGLPVISSNKTVMPEVTGDSAVLVEPDGVNFAGAVEKIIRDDNFRIKLIRGGV